MVGNFEWVKWYELNKNFSLNDDTTVNYGVLRISLKDVGIKSKVNFILFKIRKLWVYLVVLKTYKNREEHHAILNKIWSFFLIY